MMIMLTSFLAALALQDGTLPPPQPRDLFDVLEGEWVCRQAMLGGGPVFRRERWRGREDGDASGQIRSFPPRASGTESPPEEELLVSRRDRALRLTYGLTRGRLVHYRLARATLQEAVFEAIRSGSPRIISYRLIPGGRLEVMHGLENGSSRRWTYQQAGAHNAIISCDGRR